MKLNLSPSHLATIGAVLFAGYALYEFTKKPGGVLSTQPGQQQRDAGLQTFLDQQSGFVTQSFSSLVQSDPTANLFPSS